jgi:hypothetical protein
VLLARFVLFFLVVFLVRLGVFPLPTGDVSGSAAAASFSSRPVRSPCRMLWHARFRTMCALRIVLGVLLFLPHLVLPQALVAGGVFPAVPPDGWISQQLFFVPALLRFLLSASGLISGCDEPSCSVSSTRARLALSSAADLCRVHLRRLVCGSALPRFLVSFSTCSLHGLLVAPFSSDSGQKGATRNPKPNPNPKPRAGKTLTLTLSRQTLARLGFLSAPALLRAADWLPPGRRLAAETDLAADCRACPSLGGRDCRHFDFAPHSAVAEFAPRPAAGDDGDAARSSSCDSEARM